MINYAPTVKEIIFDGFYLFFSVKSSVIRNPTAAHRSAESKESFAYSLAYPFGKSCS